MNVLFGAGQLIVHPSYLEKRDPQTVADDVDMYRESVPDDCIITLRGSGEGQGMDGVMVEDDVCGGYYQSAQDGESTRELLDTAITWVIGERNARALMRRDPAAYRDLSQAQSADLQAQYDEDSARERQEMGFFRRLFERWLDRCDTAAAKRYGGFQHDA